MSAVYSVFIAETGEEMVSISIDTDEMVTTAFARRDDPNIPEFLKDAEVGDIFDAKGNLLDEEDDELETLSGDDDDDDDLEALGGKGSGNYGHAGRPGEKGGSSASELSKAERAAVETWVGPLLHGEEGEVGGFDIIQRHLRDGDPISKEEQRLVDQLTSAIEKSPAKSDMILYRGDFDENVPAEGDTWTFNRFVATSDDKEFAGNFGDTVWTIHVPKGTGVLDVNKTLGEEIESEFLLSPGTKFTIDRENKVLRVVPMKALGGEGSGNFGHGGRPGEVGGSATGGIGSFTRGADALSLAENKAALAELVVEYRANADLRAAAEVATHYASLDQPTGLLTRGIVAAALEGKTADAIFADEKIQKLLADVNDSRNSDYQVTRVDVEHLATAAPGYYATVRGVAPTDHVTYRGMKGTPRGDEFELRGPTAFTEDLDTAMSYSGGTLMEIEPGARMLPVGLLGSMKASAAGDQHATIPAFHRRSDQSVHPNGPGHGYAIDFDTDRELNTAGRFKVLSRGERRIAFEDALSGKSRVKTVKVIRVKQVGVF